MKNKIMVVLMTIGLMFGGSVAMSAPATAAPYPSIVKLTTPKKIGQYPNMSRAVAKKHAKLRQKAWPGPMKNYMVFNNRLKGRCGGGITKYTAFYWEFECVVQR